MTSRRPPGAFIDELLEPSDAASLAGAFALSLAANSHDPRETLRLLCTTLVEHEQSLAAMMTVIGEEVTAIAAAALAEVIDDE